MMTTDKVPMVETALQKNFHKKVLLEFAEIDKAENPRNILKYVIGTTGCSLVGI